MIDYLLEIGCEEIPVNMAICGLNFLKQAFTKELSSNNVHFEKVETFVTPRRFIVIIRKLPQKLPSRIVEVCGPPTKHAFDKDGNPTKSLIGFANAQGVSPSLLKTKKTEKGEFVIAIKEIKGEDINNFLSKIVPLIINEIPFSKKMRWANFDDSFARPIHWIVSLLGNEICEFEFAGVKGGRISFGHRFMAPEPYEVKSVEHYLNSIEERFVIIDIERRKRIILNHSELIIMAHGGKLIKDETLLNEVALLIEYPVVTIGRFPESFLSLPREVLITSMKTHQRYFAIEDSHGSLLPLFAVVHNTRCKDLDVITKGNETVLKARLYDAMFFFNEDLKHHIADYVPSLKERVFLEGLGTIYDKTLRLMELSEGLISPEDSNHRAIIKRAAYLSKADLITQMVGEFPELQGLMGKVYALKRGEREDVAEAIFEHYLPRFAGDILPTTPCGKILSISDKIDTIVGAFILNYIPTGGEDPYALRRSAIGVLRILMEDRFPFSLSSIIERSLKIYEKKHGFKINEFEIKNKLLEFFKSRFDAILTTEYSIPSSIADSILSVSIDFPYDVKQRAISFYKFYSEKVELFERCIIAYKRVMNILKGQSPSHPLDPLLFKENGEKKLFEKYNAMETSLKDDFENGNYLRFLERMLELKPFIDNFFDTVLVMTDDKKLRKNRIALLFKIGNLFTKFADWTKISIR